MDRKVVESRLKKWIQVRHPHIRPLVLELTGRFDVTNLQVHRPLLHVTLINALNLKDRPEACLEWLLVLVLEPNFTKATSNTPARFFKVSRTEVAPFSEAKQLLIQNQDLGPDAETMFDNVIEQSKELRSKGGVGVGLLLIIVPTAGTLHLTPFGMPELLHKTQTAQERFLDSQWEEKLRLMVETGQVI